MKAYEVRYEIRQQGAISVFEWSGWYRVYAKDKDEARAVVFERLHDKGFETRGSDAKEVSGSKPKARRTRSL